MIRGFNCYYRIIDPIEQKPVCTNLLKYFQKQPSQCVGVDGRENSWQAFSAFSVRHRRTKSDKENLEYFLQNSSRQHCED